MSNEYEQKRYDEYVKERSQLYQALLTLSERYDKWAITLSGGAVAISLAFIEKIAPRPVPWTVWLAGIAWTLLTISLLAAFISLLCAQNAVTRQVAILDQGYETFIKTGREIKTRRLENKWNRWTHYLNAIHAVTFPMGVAALCAFAFANLHQATSILPSTLKADQFQTNPPAKHQKS